MEFEGLESVEKQYSIVASGFQPQAKNPEVDAKIDKFWSRRESCYYKGDELMFQFTNMYACWLSPIYKAYFDWMLIKRDEAWAKKIDTMTSGPALIICGAAHLYGDERLIKLLRHKGWEVEHYTPFTWPTEGPALPRPTLSAIEKLTIAMKGEFIPDTNAPGWRRRSDSGKRRLSTADRYRRDSGITSSLMLLVLVLMMFWFVIHRFRIGQNKSIKRRCSLADLEANLQRGDYLQID